MPTQTMAITPRFSNVFGQLHAAAIVQNEDDSKSLQAFRSYASTSFALLSRNQLSRRRCGTRLILPGWNWIIRPIRRSPQSL